VLSDDRERLFDECLIANAKKLDAEAKWMAAEVDNQFMSEMLSGCTCYTSTQVVPETEIA